MFAARSYRRGETVEDCPLLQVDARDIGPSLSDFVYTGYRRNTVLVVLGYGMLYNHSSKANLEYMKAADNEVRFLASRPIRAGEELTINYGTTWWRSRGRQPVFHQSVAPDIKRKSTNRPKPNDRIKTR